MAPPGASCVPPAENMPKEPGILGVDHVAIVTARFEEAEEHYKALFDARVLFRGTTLRGVWTVIEGDAGWPEIRRRGVAIDSSFLRAGALTIALLDEGSPGKTGPINHVGIGCTDAEARLIKERAKALGLRFVEDSVEGFKILDRFHVTWEISRGMEFKAGGPRLDLGTGKLT